MSELSVPNSAIVITNDAIAIIICMWVIGSLYRVSAEDASFDTSRKPILIISTIVFMLCVPNLAINAIDIDSEEKADAETLGFNIFLSVILAIMYGYVVFSNIYGRKSITYFIICTLCALSITSIVLNSMLLE
tara:strand:+ start:176 stop:574 length:399 start_codon:yes stop_codon:yes gene_type:complete